LHAQGGHRYTTNLKMSFSSSQVPLDASPADSVMRIVDISGGHGLVRRLAQLGIRTGALLRRVPQGPRRGPILVEVNGTRIALGRGVARRITVAPQ